MGFLLAELQFTDSSDLKDAPIVRWEGHSYNERGFVYGLHELVAFVWGMYYVIVGSCPAALG